MPFVRVNAMCQLKGMTFGRPVRKQGPGRSLDGWARDRLPRWA
jgi:hypothetical protein